MGSNLADYVTAIHTKDSSSLDQIGSLVGAAADFAGAFGTVTAVISILGPLMGAKSDLDMLRDAVEAMINQVNDHIKAGDALERLRQIDAAVGKAQAVLDTLQAFVDAGGAGTPDAVQQVTQCREAVDDLSGESAWLTVFVDEIYYDDYGTYTYEKPRDPEDFRQDGKSFDEIDVGWGPVTPVPDAKGLVFTYIYVLASWMYAEAAFLTVAAALDKQFAGHYGGVLASDADFLQSKHDRIVSGIQDLRPEPWNDDDYLALGLGYHLGARPVFLEGTGSGTRIDYGALDVYSASTQMATCQFMREELSSSGAPNPATHRKFLIRLMKQRKLLYAKIGLPSVARVIQRLRSITDPVPNYGDWSFREICGIAGTTSLKDVKKLLQSTPPFDTPSLGTSSFRVLLS